MQEKVTPANDFEISIIGSKSTSQVIILGYWRLIQNAKSTVVLKINVRLKNSGL
jgi:hypothetical protein